MSSDFERLTLREKLRETLRGLRELIDHLELGFVPKVHELRRMTRQHEAASGIVPVSDLTVRSHVLSVLESERFTVGLNDTLEKHLNSITRDVSEVVKGRGSR